MVISPNIFSKIKRKAFSSNSSLSCQSSFKITPKAFKPIYIITFTITVFIITLLYYPMNIAFSSNPSIAFPSIRAYNGTLPNPLTYKGQTARRLLIFALYTATLFAPNYIAFTKRTSRTFMSFCHATTLT